MTAQTLTLGGHTARLNQLLGHWAKAARLKRRDRQWVALEAKRQGLTPAACRRRVTLTVVLAPRQRGGDPDCWQKSLADAMVACGLLTDDNRGGVEWAPVRYERGPRAAMAVVLEDAP